jgi:hypothetical protein
MSRQIAHNPNHRAVLRASEKVKWLAITGWYPHDLTPIQLIQALSVAFLLSG